jgi:hypothetical protein
VPGYQLHRLLSNALPPLLAISVELSGERAVFNANKHVTSLITYLGILLTFGVMFPPLAVVMCATMLSVAWQTKLSIGRFLHFAREQSAPQLAEAVDRDCKGAVSAELVRRSVFLIMGFACCFYALFLFDTLGDAVGLSGAYWVLIVMPLLPVVAWAVWAVHLQREHDLPMTQRCADEKPGDIELKMQGGHGVRAASQVPASPSEGKTEEAYCALESGQSEVFSSLHLISR